MPQAQLVYASVGLDDFADADGTAISAGGNGSLIGRTGVRVENSGFLDALAYDAMRYNAYVVGNLYYSFRGDSSITVGNTSLTEAGSDLVAELGIGGALGIGGRANLYGEASYASAFGGGDAWSGSFGLRVQW